MTSSSGSGRPAPLERFRATNGQFVGWAGLAAAAFAVGYVAVSVHTVVGLRVALGAVVAAIVIWVTQLRPRVLAYSDELRVLGTVRDAVLPYVLVEEVSIGQTLNVWAEGRRHVCVGIGTSMVKDARQRAKARRQASGTTFGIGRMRELSEKAELAQPDQTAMSYQTFVVTRIEELVEQDKKEAARTGRDTSGAAVRRPWAWLEIAALVVSVAAFMVACLV